MEDGPISMLCLAAGAGPLRQGLALLASLFYPAAALVAARLWARQHPRDWPVLALVVLMVAIGSGGLLVRFDPAGGGRWVELIASVLFILLGFYLAMRRFLFLGPLV